MIMTSEFLKPKMSTVSQVTKQILADRRESYKSELQRHREIVAILNKHPEVVAQVPELSPLLEAIKPEERS